MNYEEWVKMLQNPLKMNWSEPLTEEEKLELSSQLPKIAKVLMQEQKQIRQLKKIADKYEREASAKDSEVSKERVKMRLRKKLADKKESMKKEGLTHLCTNECERRQKKRAKKLEAKKKRDAEKSKDHTSSKDQQQNLETEKYVNLRQYREPGKSNDDDEEEEEEEEYCQNGKREEDNDNEDDGEGINADEYSQLQDYAALDENSDLAKQQYRSMVEQKMDFDLNDGSKYYKKMFNYGSNEEVKGDEDYEDEVDRLQMKLINMSEGPQQTHGKKVLQPQAEPTSVPSKSTELDFSDDFSKYLHYKYHF